MEKELRNIELGLLFLGENPRIPNLEYIEELAQDILGNGLKTPLIVADDDSKFRVLQGNRRTKAILWIKENSPEKFDELFANGVAAYVYSGLSESEMVNIIIDHGNIQGLKDPMELQQAANMLFAAGYNEKQVVISLAGLLEAQTPMKADIRKDWLSKLERVKEAMKSDPEWALQTQLEADTLLFNTRRGKIQNIHNAYRCPVIVMQALWYKATGLLHPNTPTDFGKTMPRSLTYSHVGMLYKAFKADIDADEEGAVSKDTPGPVFWAKWKEIGDKIRKDASEKASGATRAKAMSSSDMMKDVEERHWKSKGFLLMTQWHSGKGEVTKDQLNVQDGIAAVAETVADGDPELWAEVVKTAKAIVEMRQAAAQEKAAQASTRVTPTVKKKKAAKK